MYKNNIYLMKQNDVMFIASDITVCCFRVEIGMTFTPIKLFTAMHFLLRLAFFLVFYATLIS